MVYVIKDKLHYIDWFVANKMVHPECAELTTIHAKPLVLQALIIKHIAQVTK